MINKEIHKSYWIDLLRVISAFAVITIHVGSGIVNNDKLFFTPSWLTAMSFDSASRFCVPVFIMITGALLLDNKLGLFDFLKKRLPRILMPLLFYSLLYLIYDNGMKMLGGWRPGITEILNIVFFSLYEGKTCYHLWYIYMIVGIYLLVPIVSVWLRTASKAEEGFFVLLFIVGIILNYFPQHPFKIDLSVFTSYFGYALFGHYLVKYPIQKTKKVFLLCLGGYILAFLITAGGTYCLTYYQLSYKPSLFHYYLISNDMLMSVCIFIGIQFIAPKLTSCYNIIMEVSKYSFGIYLIHPLIIYITGFLGFGISRFPVYIIPIYALVIMLISYAGVKIINSISFLKRIAT